MFGSLRARLRRTPTTPEETDRRVKIVIGLGNPGQQYVNTRHNVGFRVIDELVRRHQAGEPKTRFRALVWECWIDDMRIALAKPQTYMNLSGVAAQQIVHWYKAPLDDVLVVYDDVDLERGTIRLRERGSAGGHNGLASIIESLGTTEVPRLRIGIGRGRGATTSHVLSGFSKEESSFASDIIDRAADAVDLWLSEGPIVAMNQVNSRPKSSRPEPTGADQGET
jgi:PTH1 family peptidyl-tRNA hydrolase